jgi:hypothetical protein
MTSRYNSMPGIFGAFACPVGPEDRTGVPLWLKVLKINLFPVKFNQN